MGSRQLGGYFILSLFLVLAALSWHSYAGAGQIRLAWNDNAHNEDGFIIERKLESTGAFVPIVTVGANVTSYIDTSLMEGTVYCYRVAAFNGLGPSSYSPEACAPAKSNLYHVLRIGIFRPATGEWFLDSGNGTWDGCAIDRCIQFGASGDLPVAADYDGDRKTDIAVYRQGSWYILRSSDSGVSQLGWGDESWLPAVDDYDGDRKADIAVYHPSGQWSIVRSSDSGNTVAVWGGSPGDVPIPADYDGDGKADIAIYNPNGTWSIARSSDWSAIFFAWGGSLGDIPVPADYDGDGKADIAIYNPNGTWSIARSADWTPIFLAWGGSPGDIPVPADYDGDGKADIAIYSANGTWSIARSSDWAPVFVTWGTAGDVPVP